MSAREDILLAIKFNRPPGQHNLPVVALYRSGCGYPVSYTHLDVYKRQAQSNYPVEKSFG